jgi:hypothetical protein
MAELPRTLAWSGKPIGHGASCMTIVPGEGSRPPSVSGGIQLSALPAGPEMSSQLFGLAPVGSRRFTKSPTNVTAKRIILGRGCAVSVPLPGLSPDHSRGPPSLWRGDLPRLGRSPTVSRPPSPGVAFYVLRLLIPVPGMSRERSDATGGREGSCVMTVGEPDVPRFPLSGKG